MANPPTSPRSEAPSRQALGWTVAVALSVAVFLFGSGPRDVGGSEFLSYHPWILPFRGDVTFGPGAWMTSASAWLQLALMLGVAATLRPRLWVLSIAGYILCTAPVFGAFVPSSSRYALVVLAAVLRWRDRDAIAGILLAGAALQDSLFGSLAVIAYGMSQADLGLLFAVDAVVFVVLAALLIRRGGAWVVALPALAVACELVLLVAGGAAMQDHHELPPGADECSGLDVEILHPLESGGVPFLPRGVAEGGDVIAVSGQGGVAVLEADGALVPLPQAGDWGRVEFIAWDGEELLGAAAGATLRWGRGRSGWEIVRAEGWSDSIPEILHVAAAGPESVFTSGNYPLLLEPATKRILVPADHHGFVSMAWRDGDRLRLADAWTAGVYDAATLEPIRTRAWPPWTFGARVNPAPGRLYRMDAPRKRVEIVDDDTLETVGGFRTDYSPRYLAAHDDGRILLGDYFGDQLELRDADGAFLQSLSPGRRPRNMLWSARRGAFLGVSACGLWSWTPPANAS